MLLRVDHILHEVVRLGGVRRRSLHLVLNLEVVESAAIVQRVSFQILTGTALGHIRLRIGAWGSLLVLLVLQQALSLVKLLVFSLFLLESATRAWVCVVLH